MNVARMTGLACPMRWLSTGHPGTRSDSEEEAEAEAEIRVLQVVQVGACLCELARSGRRDRAS